MDDFELLDAWKAGDRKAGDTLLQRTPPGLEHGVDEALHRLDRVPGVLGHSQVHVWRHGKGVIVGTLHVQVEEALDAAGEKEVLARAHALLRAEGITHVTVQLEPSAGIAAAHHHHHHARALDRARMAHQAPKRVLASMYSSQSSTSPKS